MKIKKGASLNGLKIEMRLCLIQADLIWQLHGQELVVTSGTDGEHSSGSLHYYGYALDFRTRYFNYQEIESVYNSLLNALQDKCYDVILHSTHIHVEYHSIIKEI